MKREESIRALLKKANADFVELRMAYDSSLHAKHISEDLKVSIKNIFENLRSCLDYIAHEIFDKYCAAAPKPARLYFPVRPTPAEFSQTIANDYTNLSSSAPSVYQTLESVQPFNDLWLGQFNKLNNKNKHQDLVE